MRESEYGTGGLCKISSPLPARAETRVDSSVAQYAGPSSLLLASILGGRVFGVGWLVFHGFF